MHATDINGFDSEASIKRIRIKLGKYPYNKKTKIALLILKFCQHII